MLCFSFAWLLNRLLGAGRWFWRDFLPQSWSGQLSQIERVGSLNLYISVSMMTSTSVRLRPDMGPKNRMSNEKMRSLVADDGFNNKIWLHASESSGMTLVLPLQNFSTATPRTSNFF